MIAFKALETLFCYILLTDVLQHPIGNNLQQWPLRFTAVDSFIFSAKKVDVGPEIISKKFNLFFIPNKKKQQKMKFAKCSESNTKSIFSTTQRHFQSLQQTLQSILINRQLTRISQRRIASSQQEQQKRTQNHPFPPSLPSLFKKSKLNQNPVLLLLKTVKVIHKSFLLLQALL